jgi:hypothetical protein
MAASPFETSKPLPAMVPFIGWKRKKDRQQTRSAVLIVFALGFDLLRPRRELSGITHHEEPEVSAWV